MVLSPDCFSACTVLDYVQKNRNERELEYGQKMERQHPAVNGVEQRRVYVYLPTMYEADPERRYPVLYMFDGQNVFFDADATYGKSWGVADYLDSPIPRSSWRQWSAMQAPTTSALWSIRPTASMTRPMATLTARGRRP